VSRSPLLFLDDVDVRALLTPERALAAVEGAFRTQGEGTGPAPKSLAFPLEHGGFHVKAALQEGTSPLFAAKINGNFPQNFTRLGLPTIQGLLYLADASNGAPRAVIASGALTALRTAAASAVAAKYLALPGAERAAIIGCGVQGAVHVPMLRAVRQLTSLALFDADHARVEALAQLIVKETGLRVTVEDSVAAASRAAQIIVTCTTAKAPILGADDVVSGAFIAAVGADAPSKSEIAPALMARAAVVCDLTSQCASGGDLFHAIAAGAMTADQVRAELGEVVAGRKPGRRGPDEILIFDSTGTALLDVAAAAAIEQAARAAGVGTPLDFRP
jgi:alanine dehydrogenase